MEYFSEATNIVQREDLPTINRVIPVVDSLENAVKKMNHRENAFVNALCECLLNSLESLWKLTGFNYSYNPLRIYYLPLKLHQHLSNFQFLLQV